MQLTEQYRPSTWADVVGQEKVVAKIQALAKRGIGGRAYWLSGGSGQGKTTIARLIAAEIAGPLATMEDNAKDIDAEYVRGMTRSWHTTVLASPGSDKIGRAWILNESHNLRASVCELFLTRLEEIPPHVVVIFTTTTDEDKGLFEGYDNSPAFMSRCLTFKLARVGLAEKFAERARAIAQKEGLDGKPIKDYVELVKQERNNMRAVLQKIEAGYMAD